MKVTAAWVFWLITSMVFLLSTRNPVYLLVSIILLLFLGARLAKGKNQPSWVTQNLRFLATMLILSTLINALFTHTGRTVLLAVPENLPLIGGDLTLESMVYGAVNGLVIGALYLLFNIFNLALSIKQITRLIPRAFHPIATMVTISLTFFPSIQQRTREIKEAQMIRGNPMKKISDWLPIIVPLLVTSLENAILLSESITSRGFHTQTSSQKSNLALIGLILAVFTVFSGWVLRLYDYPLLLSVILYIIGSALIISVFILSGKQTQVTHLHQEIWRGTDFLSTGLLSISLLLLLILLFTDNATSFAYSPYPVLKTPNLNLVGILLSLIPGIPLVFTTHD
jgi:energy-coupling factor transporter transmembrane protein EcfT